MRIILHRVTITYAPCSLVNEEEFNRAVRVTCPDRGCRPWRRSCRRCTATLRSTAAPTRATWIAASGRRAGGPIADTGLVYKKSSNSCTYEEGRKMLQNIIEHIIAEWAYYSRFVGTACARQIWWPWACPPDPYARCMPASSLLSSPFVSHRSIGPHACADCTQGVCLWRRSK